MKTANRIVEADFLPWMGETPHEKPRILIVDKSRDFTYAIKLALEETGHSIVCEENDATIARQQP